MRGTQGWELCCPSRGSKLHRCTFFSWHLTHVKWHYNLETVSSWSWCWLSKRGLTGWGVQRSALCCTLVCSGCGKTRTDQVLLVCLISCQLPPPECLASEMVSLPGEVYTHLLDRFKECITRWPARTLAQSIVCIFGNFSQPPAWLDVILRLDLVDYSPPAFVELFSASPCWIVGFRAHQRSPLATNFFNLLLDSDFRQHLPLSAFGSLELKNMKKKHKLNKPLQNDNNCLMWSKQPNLKIMFNLGLISAKFNWLFYRTDQRLVHPVCEFQTYAQ